MHSVTISSTLSTANEKTGGMKKKPQIKALNKEQSNTGRISNNIAMMDNTSSNTNAIPSGSTKPENKKHKAEVKQTIAMLTMYCLRLENVLIENKFKNFDL